MNAYSILGVSKYCTIIDIKKSYRKLSLQYHPDRNNTDEAKIRILEINEAYEKIRDDESRRKYDEEDNYYSSYTNRNNNNNDLTDIFHMMYTLAMTHMQKKTDLYSPSTHTNVNANANANTNIDCNKIDTSMLITIDQSYYGCILPIEIQPQLMTKYKYETIYITIDPGVYDDEIIIWKKQGNILCDVYVTIHIQNLTNFQRIGLDLVYKKNITLKDSLCGFSFEFEHINGDMIVINNKNKMKVIQPNDKKIIPNFGMIRDLIVGNLIIEFYIEFPSMLSKNQIAHLDIIL